MLAHAMKSLGFSAFYQLSVTQQTILADCLERGRAEITLPAMNAYADTLCRSGWLRELPAMAMELRTYVIPTAKWQELQSLKSQILTPNVLEDVRRLRAQTGR